MADEQDVLLREIDEDLKQERLAQLWKTYGNYAIAGALVLVLGVAGTKGWQSYQLSQHRAEGERMAKAQRLIDQGKPKDALTELQALAGDAGKGYAMLARFRAAALTGKDGDPAKAAGMYAAIADDGGVSGLYRDLAVVLGALQELEGGGKGGPLVARAAEVAKGTGPWRFNAREVGALAALGAGDAKAAGAIFKELSEAASAPGGVKARATEMLKITGIN
ncbi:MAG: tetratricopeptide repeat protein [Rhodospirillaceae bacterium]